MSFELDPDLKSENINKTTVQEIKIPADKGIFLNGLFNTDWEQAVILFINGSRLDEQLGSFGRKSELKIPISHEERTLYLAGWHKQGSTKTEESLKECRILPWIPSRGKITGNVVCWDDSNTENNYNDCQVIYIIE